MFDILYKFYVPAKCQVAQNTHIKYLDNFVDN